MRANVLDPPKPFPERILDHAGTFGRREESAKDFDITQVIMVNELYSLRHSAVDARTEGVYKDEMAAEEDGPSMTLTLSGWGTNYEPVTLGAGDEINADMTAQELAEVYVDKLIEKRDAEDDNRFLKVLAARMEFCGVQLWKAYTSGKERWTLGWGNKPSDTTSSMDGEDKRLSWSDRWLPSYSVVRTFMVCAFVILGGWLLPIEAVLPVACLVVTLFTLYRQMDCYEILARAESDLKWKPSLITMHVGGLRPSVRQDYSEGDGGGRWWRELDPDTSLRKQQVTDRSCIMISFRTENRGTSIMKKMKAADIIRTIGGGKKKLAETKDVAVEKPLVGEIPEDVRSALKDLGLYMGDDTYHDEIMDQVTVGPFFPVASFFHLQLIRPACAALAHSWASSIRGTSDMKWHTR